MAERSNGAKLRFGVIGCGAIGPTHAGAISQINDAELVAVADPIAERARALAKKHGLTKIYQNAVELCADPEIDVVCICTPSGMHADHAIGALRAGKHAIVEKPMEVSLPACDRMIQATEQTGKKLTIISQHRFDPATVLVRDAIQSGKLGKIILATADVKWWRSQEYYDSGDWRGTFALDGGGALMNQGVHTVDLLQWLAGGVASVFAHVRTAAHKNIEVEDVAVAALTFTNGAVGTLMATTAAVGGLPARIDLFGTEGAAIIEGDALKSLSLKTGETFQSEHAAAHALSVARGGTASVKDQATTRNENAATAAANPGAVWGDAHRAQIQDMIRAIRTNTPPAIDARAARRPLEIILAVYESSRTGKPVALQP